MMLIGHYIYEPLFYIGGAVVIIATILTSWGKWGKASVLHDFLYIGVLLQDIPGGFSSTPITRKWADQIFYDAMIVEKTKKWKAKVMWASVRAFGWLAWK